MSSASVPLLRKRQNQRDSIGERTEMEARDEHRTQQKFKLIYLTSIGIAFTFFVLLLVWLFYYREGFAWQTNPFKEFNWHPLLMFVGMIFLQAQSLLIFRTGRNLVKKKLKLIHMSFNLLATILSIFGLIAAFDSHNLRTPPVPNLYTLHSWIGLITVIFFVFQFLIGFTAFLYPGYPGRVRAAILPIHVPIGRTIFLFAIITAITGLLEKAIFALGDKYATRTGEGWMINCLGILLLFFAALVLYLLNADEYKRTPIPEDQIQLEPHTN